MSHVLELFRPGMCVDSITDIDLDDLRSRGFDALIVDLDNTLLPWRSSEVPESSKDWVKRVRRVGMKLCIVSNTHNPARLNKVAACLGIPSMPKALKPRRRGFARGAGMMGCEPAKTVVVGDQILTDILGGNRAGMFTVLVKPMHSHEFIGTKISRLIERGILALLSRRRGASLEQTRGKDSQKERDSK